MKKVMSACIDDSTRYGYRLTQRKLLVHIWKKGKAMRERLLNKKVISDLDAVDGGKGVHTRRLGKALDIMSEASSNFQPIKLQALTAADFLGYLRTLSDTKNHQYRKSYGDCRSGLMNLFVECREIPSQEFLPDLKKTMKGLKNMAAKARGNVGANLGTGKHPISFQVYKAICKWMLEDDAPEAIFAHCFLTVT